MICPACQNSLTEIHIQDVTLDICRNGCGGIWFDWHELKKFDEPHEEAGKELLNIPISDKFTSSNNDKKICPRCKDVIMMRHFSSIKKEIEVDECGNCGGFWLDAGELNSYRDQFKTEEERQSAAKKYISELFDPLLKEKRDQTKAQSEKTNEMISVFKYICPNYYVPKKIK